MRASCDRSLSPSPSVCPKISVLTTAPTLCPGSGQAHTWTISSSSRHHHHHHHHHHNNHHHHTPSSTHHDSSIIIIIIVILDWLTWRTIAGRCCELTGVLAPFVRKLWWWWQWWIMKGGSQATSVVYEVLTKQTPTPRVAKCHKSYNPCKISEKN